MNTTIYYRAYKHREIALFFVFFISLIGTLAFSEQKVLSQTSKDLLPWHIEADRISKLPGDNLYMAEGKVIITRENQTLEADRIIYDIESTVINAEGNIRLLTPEDILTCDSAVFNLKEKTGTILNGELFLKTNHFYIQGKEISKTGPETYILSHCRITSCDGDPPDWSITGSEVKLKIEGYATIKNAAFRIRHVPLLFFPYIIFPAKIKRQTGLLPPSIGYSQLNGVDFELPFFWDTSEQTDLTFYERYMSERGIKHGLEFRYINGNESKGAFLFDIISDKKGEKDLYNKDEVSISPYERANETRYWLRGRSDQHLGLGIDAKLDVDIVSDYDYLREFKDISLGYDFRVKLDRAFGRPLDEIRSPLRRSSLLITKNFQDYSLQASSSFYQRPEDIEDDKTSQPIALLGLSVPSRRILNLPVFFSIDSDGGYIYSDEGQKGQRLSINPSIKYPFWHFDYLEIEPFFKYFLTYQWLDEYEGLKGEQTRDSYEVGLRMATTLEKIFNVETGSVKGVKHKFQPSLTYTFRPYKDEDKYKAWYEAIDLLERTNTISLSLDNYFNTRRVDKKGRATYSQGARFVIAQDYDLDEAKGRIEQGERKKPFDPLRVSLSLTPYPSLDLSATLNWDHYEHTISSSSVSLDVALQRGNKKQDYYGLDFIYTKDSVKSLNYQFGINLAYGFSIGAERKRDFITTYDIENSYWVGYESQCWGVKLYYEDLEEDTRAMVVFSLLGAGEIGVF